MTAFTMSATPVVVMWDASAVTAPSDVPVLADAGAAPAGFRVCRGFGRLDWDTTSV